MSLTESDDCSNMCDERHKNHNSFVGKEIFQCLLLRFNSNLKEEQDGPSLESSSYLNLSLRYLGSSDPGTFGPLDLGTLGPLPSSNT